MPYDYSKLRGRIVEVCGTQEEFSRRIGISPRSLSLKMTGKRPFKQQEIAAAVLVLNLNRNDIPLYFFGLKVQD